jgi:hypothetical protein
MHKSIENLLMIVVNRLTSTCEVITRKVSEGLDRRLSFRERFQIRLHIMFCELCYRYREQLLTIHHVLQKSREPESIKRDTTRLSGEAREKIKLALKERTRHL